MRAALVALVLWICACDDDGEATKPPDASTPVDAARDAPPLRQCGTAGAGSVEGTVMGVEIAPVMRTLAYPDDSGLPVLLLSESVGDACERPSTGDRLGVLFCNAFAPGPHPVVSSSAFQCPGPNAGAIVQHDGIDVARSTGGTITITRADAECVGGSFSIEFSGEQLTGTFDAFVCPPLTAGRTDRP